MHIPACRTAVLWLTLITCMPTLAATEAEETMFKAPMPHRLLGGHGAKVHLARLQGYLFGVHDNADQLLQLKASIRKCADNRGALPLRVTSVWPDFMHSHRTDAYFSANRSITYYKSVLYRIDPRDCGLYEHVISTALLLSAIGQCDIDLIEKTASGACDARAHADAKVPLRRNRNTAAQSNAVLEQLAQRSSVELAARYRKLKTARTDMIKTILGLQCVVWNNLLDPGGTICLSLGGSFAGSQLAHMSDQSGMMLEMTTQVATKLDAVEALLDADVDGAIFAPYLAGGYQIRETGVRR